MAGWIMSPPHHANLLDPRWTAIGIAADNGPDGVLWVNVFGDHVTCPPASSPQPEPVVLANPVVARPARTLGDGAADSGPINPTGADTELYAPTEPEAAGATNRAVVADATTLPIAAAAAAPTGTALALAMVVSDRTPSAGQVITVVNRTRDHGVARVAAMTTSSMPTTAIGADATRRLTVLDPGALRIDLAATTPAGLALTVSARARRGRRSAGADDQPRRAAPGGVRRTARAGGHRPQPGGAPPAARAVRFRLGGVVGHHRHRATTASPRPTMRADVTAGSWPVRAEVLTEAGAVAASTEATVAGRRRPRTRGRGRRSVHVEHRRLGDARRQPAYDADGENLDVAWDLDGDGQYDDATGAHGRDRVGHAAAGDVRRRAASPTWPTRSVCG